MMTSLAAALALALAPGAAWAAWQAPVSVQSPYENGGLPPVVAVADDGRAAAMATQIRPYGVALVAAGGAVAGLDGPRLDEQRGLAFAPDGALVAAGSVDSGERAPDVNGKGNSCCARPAVERWPPGGGAGALAILQPTIHDNYSVQFFALDGTGAAVFLAAGDDVDALDALEPPVHPPLVAVRVPADGTPAALRTLPYRAPPEPGDPPYPYAARARADGAGGFAVLNDGDRRWRRFDVGRGRWRDRPSSAPMTFGLLVLGPRGGRVLARLDARHRVVLRVEGRRTRVLGGTARELFGLAVGEDGTIAILTGDRTRHVMLRTIDPRGRVGARRVLGVARRRVQDESDGTAFLALDARGHAHVAWNAPGTDAIVAGPHGRRRLPGPARAMAVSPGGATAVALQHGGALQVAVDTIG